MLDASVLGCLGIGEGGENLTPTAPKIRQVIALLLLNVGRTVPFSAFVDELWSDRPPRSFQTTVQTYILQLRRGLGRGEPPDRHLNPIATVPSGYVLHPDGIRLDVHRFQDLVARGNRALVSSDPREALRCFSDSLLVWKGKALTDVRTGPRLSAVAVRLEEERAGVFRHIVQLSFQLGRHPDMIAPLTVQVAEHPFDEELHKQLMTALDRSGRRRDALDVYARLRRVLADELGLGPSASVRRVHQDILFRDRAIPSPAGSS